MSIEFLQSALDSFSLLEPKTGLSSEIMKSANDHLDKMKKDKRAVKRNKECLDEAWLEMEQVVFSAFVCSKACLKKECESCFEKHEILIKYYHCKKHLCAECD